MQSFGKSVIFQSVHELEFFNNDLLNYCINNDIKIIHGSPHHPQSEGACESCRE